MECHSVPWYKEPQCLWKNWKEFFPARGMSAADTLNALVRFILYSCVIISVYRNDYTPLAIGILVALMVTMVYAPRLHSSRGHPPAGTHAHRKETLCTAPTPDNPFMNVLPHEYTQDKSRACPRSPAQDAQVSKAFEKGLIREVSDVYKKRASDRQFITMPVTTAIPDTKAFSNFLFSETTNGPKCK